MNLDWLAASNPVAIWWYFLLIVSIANIALWMLLHRRYRQLTPSTQRGIFRVEVLVLLCAAYVFGCAFRSVLPRADVQRICLFDTWLSSVLVGRSVATVAEICFAIQLHYDRLLRRSAYRPFSTNPTFSRDGAGQMPIGCCWQARLAEGFSMNPGP